MKTTNANEKHVNNENMLCSFFFKCCVYFINKASLQTIIITCCVLHVCVCVHKKGNIMPTTSWKLKQHKNKHKPEVTREIERPTMTMMLMMMNTRKICFKSYEKYYDYVPCFVFFLFCILMNFSSEI